MLDSRVDCVAVRTGKYRTPTYSERTDHPPDRVYDNFADLVDDLV